MSLLSSLVKFGINQDLPCLAICPGAEFGPAKKWPSCYYAEVCNEYLIKDWNVLVFGSINDDLTGSKIESDINKQYSQSFFNLVGKTSLIDAIDLMSHCKKAVTNDSGLMHIAGAVDCKIIALYGSSSPFYTPPLISNDKGEVIYKNLDCSPCHQRTCPLKHLIVQLFDPF